LIDIVSIFPGMFEGVFNESMIKRARDKGLLQINTHDLRDYSDDKHRKVDDYPFGGGPGMVMKPEPFFKAVKTIRGKSSKKSKTILMSPQGTLFNHEKAQELSKEEHLIILCSHYEGVDERVRLYLAEEEISIGNYILTGGEIPAMVIVDALVRFIPGVLSDASLEEETFVAGLLEYPQYTRPREYEGMSVPEVLLSGNHELIRQWRAQRSVERTLKRRPDLLQNAELTREQEQYLKKYIQDKTQTQDKPGEL
jgi:tRNA (guanine37-N1)-methyltransferase